MFSGVDKMIVAFLTPYLVKGLSMGASAIGVAPDTLDMSGAATVILSLVAGAIVYFIPNKLKS
jgi:hypothetical protein